MSPIKFYRDGEVGRGNSGLHKSCHLISCIRRKSHGSQVKFLENLQQNNRQQLKENQNIINLRCAKTR